MDFASPPRRGPAVVRYRFYSSSSILSTSMSPHPVASRGVYIKINPTTMAPNQMVEAAVKYPVHVITWYTQSYVKEVPYGSLEALFSPDWNAGLSARARLGN